MRVRPTEPEWHTADPRSGIPSGTDGIPLNTAQIQKFKMRRLYNRFEAVHRSVRAVYRSVRAVYR
jgi:hypothetical protein